MNIIKRDGTKVPFDRKKIENAINKAFLEVDGKIYEDETIIEIVDYIENKITEGYTVEQIQDLVEEELWNSERPDVARAYTRFRYKKELLRKANNTDESIKGIIECDNEEIKQENSNKNPTVLSVQRDYMAGEVSKDITNRLLLPKEIVKAHKEGIIHFHDADYFAQHSHNCDLINLEDMLQNGTVISETMIEKPHSFKTACNIATQIIAQVASSQYGK